MVTPWRDLAAAAAAITDEQFGERLRLVPMREGDYAEPSRDPDREPVDVVGIPQFIAEQSLGLAGDHAGAPMIERIAVGTIRYTVSEASLSALDPREGDLAYLTDRGNARYEINRVAPTARGRVVLYLVKASQP